MKCNGTEDVFQTKYHFHHNRFSDFVDATFIDPQKHCFV